MKNYLSEKELKERKKDRPSDIRGEYFRDQTAIIHSMPFRRLKHKTQVFFSPRNDHICTRIEHVQHVATVAATICKGLSKTGWELDTELAYSIGLGHDLGHAPFGHAGETALTKCLGIPFMHELNSYRVVNSLANDGKGLNLTYAVNDGILCHNGEKFEQELEPSKEKKDLDKIADRKIVPNTWEGCIVRFSDKLAYLGRDIEDALVSKLITISELPKCIQKKEIDAINAEIINELVIDIIQESQRTNKIRLSDGKFQILQTLKDFNYKYIYPHEKLSDYKYFIDKMITSLFEYLKGMFCKYGLDFNAYKKEKIELAVAFGDYLEKMQDVYKDDKNVPNQILSDYISGMTDSYAIESMKQISLPQSL